ncbi:hypothetical protein, partial [Synechococcus sp. 65AY6Li]|uniref:hypothetical protein n=1 Tax=Synechococcus sp. 65AY6Li TaxID=1351840 RepID=UPI001438B7F5
LHVIGAPPTAEEAIATLVSIASIDRPEEGILGLPRIIAQSLGRDIDEIYRNRDRGHLADGGVTCLVGCYNSLPQIQRMSRHSFLSFLLNTCTLF